MPTDLFAEKPKNGPRDLFADSAASKPAEKGFDWNQLPEIAKAVGSEWSKFFLETPERAAAFTENAIDSIPVVGPMATKGLDEAGAGLRSAVRGQDMDTSRQEIAQGTQGRAGKHAEAAIAGKLTGTTAPLAVLGTTALGSRLLGMTGNLPARMLFGGASGGALTGADTFARTGDADQSWRNAQIGFGLGAGAPLAFSGAGKLANMMTGTKTNKAATMLNRAITDDQIPLDSLASRMDDLGEGAILADLGPNLQRQAGALASVPGPAQQSVRNTIGARSAQASQRVQSDVARVMGTGKPAFALADDIAAQQSQQAKPLYDAVRDVPVQPSGAIAAVLKTPMGKQAYNQAVRLAANDGIDASKGMTVGVLDYVKRSLDDVASASIRQGKNNLARQASNMARALTVETDKLVPQYKAARDAFAGHAKIIDALEGGQNVFDKRMHPQRLAEMMKGMSASEREAVVQGARGAIEDLMGTARNDPLAVRALFQKGYNKEKLALLIGDDAANELMRGINREIAFAKTRDVVTGNSETAARQASQGEIAPHLGLGDRSTSPWQAILRAFDRAVASVRGSQQKGANQALSELLTRNRVDSGLLEALGKASDAVPNPIAPAAVPLLSNGG